ncbi:MAG: hypothetical protein KKD28_12380 [Chloroflexi bacterium]|nr:hypothetical protein [Chloroflexota bacterium]MBU1662256.1 hypothetical protein [Chloroflexota bacterium]
MNQTITITLPNTLFQPIQRISKATNQPVETLLLDALHASLPSLTGLPDDLIQDLAQLDSLNNDALRKVMLEIIPAETRKQVQQLLLKNQAGLLQKDERSQLENLQRQIDKVALRKARAAVLLRFRGQRIPTLAELRQLTLG